MQWQALLVFARWLVVCGLGCVRVVEFSGHVVNLSLQWLLDAVFDVEVGVFG